MLLVFGCQYLCLLPIRCSCLFVFLIPITFYFIHYSFSLENLAQWSKLLINSSFSFFLVLSFLMLFNQLNFRFQRRLNYASLWVTRQLGLVHLLRVKLNLCQTSFSNFFIALMHQHRAIAKNQLCISFYFFA